MKLTSKVTILGSDVLGFFSAGNMAAKIRRRLLLPLTELSFTTDSFSLDVVALTDSKLTLAAQSSSLYRLFNPLVWTSVIDVSWLRTSLGNWTWANESRRALR